MGDGLGLGKGLGELCVSGGFGGSLFSRSDLARTGQFLISFMISIDDRKDTPSKSDRGSSATSQLW